MTKPIVAGLILINLILGALVWMRLGGTRPAYADIGSATHDYTTVAGFMNNGDVIFILDSATGVLATVGIDANGRITGAAAARNVANDLARLAPPTRTPAR